LSVQSSSSSSRRRTPALPAIRWTAGQANASQAKSTPARSATAAGRPFAFLMADGATAGGSVPARQAPESRASRTAAPMPIGSATSAAQATAAASFRLSKPFRLSRPFRLNKPFRLSNDAVSVVRQKCLFSVCVQLHKIEL
jgi:hypothetical protein